MISRVATSGLTAVLISLLLGACANRNEEVTIFSRTLLPEIECLAVAPFENLSNTPAAGKILENLVQNELLESNHFHLMEAGSVRRALETLQLKETFWQDPQDLTRVGQAILVHGILTGKVIDYGYRDTTAIGESEPQVAVELVLYHLPTGNKVWSSVLRGSSRTVGPRNRDPVSRVAMQSAHEVMGSLMQALGNRPVLTNQHPCGIVPGS